MAAIAGEMRAGPSGSWRAFHAAATLTAVAAVALAVQAVAATLAGVLGAVAVVTLGVLALVAAPTLAAAVVSRLYADAQPHSGPSNASSSASGSPRS
ncbi:hypothetical protein [Halosegnis marinus]|uniref:Membrane transport protein MMPL domain-containing protein n=1 Tax=Halosegnis marinus TaxID=3034023 RepID=A0ABD5ZM84_9EURY|nr:hypothetical protein [Halosegnis sp. DT85]